MKARKKKGLRQYKLLFYSVILIIILLLVLLLCWINSLIGLKRFTVIDRTEKIVQARKEDDVGVTTLAWIKVQGTNIDYPVVYAPGYDFSYMADDFAWTEDNYKDLVDVVRIKGHNIKNLSKKPLIANPNHNRFEQLLSYTYFDFVKDNQFIQYTINGKNYVYRVYSVAYLYDSYLDLFSNYDDRDMRKLIDRSLDNSIFDFGVDVDLDDNLITLSTCTRMFAGKNKNFVVTGRLLRKNEAMRLNRVKKTMKYKELEKIMEGGDLDEDV